MSSSLPTATGGVTVGVDDACYDDGDLFAVLAALPDPRRSGGRRHPTGYVLAVLVASTACAGFESLAASAQWAKAAGRQVLLALGAAPDPLTGRVWPPSAATLGRVAAALDIAALEKALAAWTASRLDRTPAGADRLAVAVDGKTVRGARTGSQAAPHLLSAATHQAAVVLAQRQVPNKTSEIPMVTDLLADLQTAGHDLGSMVFTLDALHTQHATATLLEQAGAGYVLTVKGNQPGLRTAIINQLHAHPEPGRTSQLSRGHGRTEQRTLQVVPADTIAFPGARQIFQIVRYTGGLDGQRTRKEVVHGITNLSPAQADPAALAALVRGHWSIENSVHWVRDVTYREDAGRARTGNTPAVLAALRNVVTSALRLAGALNIAAARRAVTLDPRAIIHLLTRGTNPDKSSL